MQQVVKCEIFTSVWNKFYGKKKILWKNHFFNPVRNITKKKKKWNDTRNKFWRTVFYNIDDDDVDDFQGIKQRESSEKRTDEVFSIVGMAGIG